MQLGVFNYIPETRFVPTAVNDIKLIYDGSSERDKIELDEIASILGYKQPKGGALYRRIHSMIAYGLMSGRGIFKITEMGKEIADSFHDYERRKQLYRQAILSVTLWSELYKTFKKNPPENLEDSLEEITGAEPDEVEKVANDIRRWYIEDIGMLPENLQTVGFTTTMSYDIEGARHTLQDIKRQLSELVVKVSALEKTLPPES